MSFLTSLFRSDDKAYAKENQMYVSLCKLSDKIQNFFFNMPPSTRNLTQKPSSRCTTS